LGFCCGCCARPGVLAMREATHGTNKPNNKRRACCTEFLLGRVSERFMKQRTNRRCEVVGRRPSAASILVSFTSDPAKPAVQASMHIRQKVITDARAIHDERCGLGRWRSMIKVTATCDEGTYPSVHCPIEARARQATHSSKVGRAAGMSFVSPQSPN